MRLKTKKGCFNAAALSEMQQSDFVDQHKDNPYFGETEDDRVKFLTGIHEQACRMLDNPAYKQADAPEIADNTVNKSETMPKKTVVRKKKSINPEEKKE